MRRLFLVVALAAALVLPASVLGASTTGTTPESFTIASTISATFPASATYSGPAAALTTPTLTILNAATNAPSGLTVTLQTSTFTGTPSGSIATNKRSSSAIAPSNTAGGMVGHAAYPVGSWSNASTVLTIGSSSGASSADLTWTMSVDGSAAPAGTSYAGALQFSATTNP